MKLLIHSRPDAGSRSGSILGMVLIVLVAMGLLGVGMLALSTADSLETAKSLTKLQAFWNAEAGIEDVKALAWKLRNTSNPEELFPASGSRAWTGTTSRGGYAVSISQPYSSPPGYLVESRADSHGGRKAGVRVELLQLPALGMGVFGEDRLRIQPNVAIYSYNSSTVSGQPVPSDSTGAATIGSNELIDLSPGLTLDGSIVLGMGEDDLPAECDGCELLPTTDSPPIHPDPLGIVGGPLAIELDAARISNDNASVPEISGTEFTVPNNQTVVLPPGDYYLTDVYVRGDLEVESTNGVVTIFLEGPFDSSPGCTINNNGTPPRFLIFSNSTEPVNLQPQGTLSALIYAPYSLDVRIKPGDNFYGLVWGGDVQLFPGDAVYVDESLLEYEAFTIYRVGLSNWREFSGK